MNSVQLHSYSTRYMATLRSTGSGQLLIYNWWPAKMKKAYTIMICTHRYRWFTGFYFFCLLTERIPINCLCHPDDWLNGLEKFLKI